MDHHTRTAEQEKSLVALSSVGAAILLTGGKLVVGFMTGSLGILSEAAHSALDLVAAIITYVAVRTSDKPADLEHRYGHEKIENLSALIETQLLLFTCIWIIYEAVRRLFFHEVHVEANVWAFLVVIVSIVIDISRSRALSHVAKKHQSQALEADALHFSTDVWSSCVVLLGLVFVLIGEHTGLQHYFGKADALAALGVAAIVIHVSMALGRKTIDALLDSAPAGLDRQIEDAVYSIDGVRGCRQIRLRQSGKRTFVDLSIDVDKGLSIEAATIIAEAVERQIRSHLPFADVVVRTGPAGTLDENISARLRAFAEAEGHKVHSIFVLHKEDGAQAELHLEVPPTQHILDAHTTAMELEHSLLNKIPVLKSVDIKTEPGEAESVEVEDITSEVGDIEALVKGTLASIPGVLECHQIMVRKSAHGLHISVHAVFPDDMTMEAVEKRVSEAESSLHQNLRTLERLLIHAEPASFARH